MRAKAAMLGYDVITSVSLSPVVPGGLPAVIAFRQKVPSPTFCCSLLNVPSWVDPGNPATANNNYRDFGKQNSPAFVASYVPTDEHGAVLAGRC